MKKWLALLLLLALLSGCAASTADTDAATMTVYRLYAGSDAGELVQPESCPLESGERADLDTALRLFMEKPRHSHLRRAVSGDVTLLGSTAQNGLVTLDFSENFLSLSPMEQSLAAFCATLTLCKLDDVDAVSITAGGTTVFQGLDAEDALLQDTDSDPYTRRLHLYFADETDTWLVSEYHSLSLSDDTPLERYVMEELLRGPNDPALHSAIPAGTELISCRTENGVCTVDLSAAFVENRPQTALGERLTGWAFVNCRFEGGLKYDAQSGLTNAPWNREKWGGKGSNGKIDFPIRLKALTVGMNRMKLDLVDFKPTVPSIRLGTVMIRP